MKKLVPILTTLIIASIIIIVIVALSNKKQMVTVKENNTKKLPIKIIPNHFQDTQCAMTIKSENYAAQVISPSGTTWFFDDIGCLIKWLEDKEFKEKATIWTHAEDSGGWIDARKAWYVLGASTPMKYGFGAREKKEKDAMDFDKMRLKMLRGENLTDPRVKKQVLGL